MYTFLCKDSISGVFSGVYEAWAGGYNRQEVCLKAGNIENYELFMEYKRIADDLQLAEKVSRTIRARFGEETYEWICYALCSNGEDKANVVYQMIRFGIEHKFGYELKNHLTEPSIRRVFELGRGTYNEAHHYLGFVRFSELENGILYAKIEARNYVLEFLANHFAQRLPGENWMIHDTGQRRAVIHQSYGDWMVTDEESIAEWVQSPKTCLEEEYQMIWQHFCNAVSIEARKNLFLQRQNLPLRFRNYMEEFSNTL